MSTHTDSATGAASAFKSETRTIRHRQPQKSQSYRRSGASRGTRAGYSRCLIGGRTITSVVKKARNIWTGVPKAAGYAALKVCLSVNYRLETESMAAIHRDADSSTSTARHQLEHGALQVNTSSAKRCHQVSTWECLNINVWLRTETRNSVAAELVLSV